MKTVLSLLVASTLLTISCESTLTHTSELIFKSLDVNRDGFLTQYEFDKAITRSINQGYIRKLQKPIVSIIPINAFGAVDGKLSPEQFMANIRNMSSYSQRDILATFEKVSIDPVSKELYYNANGMVRLIQTNYVREKCPNQTSISYNFEKFQHIFLSKSKNISCGELVLTESTSKNVVASNGKESIQKQVVVVNNGQNDQVGFLSKAAAIGKVFLGTLIATTGFFMGSAAVQHVQHTVQSFTRGHDNGAESSKELKGIEKVINEKIYNFPIITDNGKKVEDIIQKLTKDLEVSLSVTANKNELLSHKNVIDFAAEIFGGHNLLVTFAGGLVGIWLFFYGLTMMGLWGKKR